MDPSTKTVVPIALRRTKRRATEISPAKPATNIDNSITTPTRKRASKRVRFSEGDIGSSTSALTGTTGLTPAVGRALLSTPKSKRSGTPARAVTMPSSRAIDYDYVQFTPLRQALDERCKRRIRRNHLSAEVNAYETDKRVNARQRKEIEEKDEELQHLKIRLAEAQVSKNTQQKSLADSAATQSRLEEVEQELETLRQSFALSDGTYQQDDIWDHIPRGSNGPNSEGGDTIQIYEDGADPYQPDDLVQPHHQDQADAALMGLELESARQAKQTLLSSFSRNNRSFDASLNFADSPAKPRTTNTSNAPPTPQNLHHTLSKQLKAATSRAEDAELALQALEGEVRALGFTSTTTTSPNAQDTSASTNLAILADHFRSIRLDLERLLPGETTIAFSNAELFPELMCKIKGLMTQLSSREQELKSLRGEQRSLKGNFDHALMASGKAEAKIKELEKAIDEMASESLNSRMRAQEYERQRDEKSKDVEKLQVALGKYRDEVGRLESLISKVETEHKDAMLRVQQESSSAWEQVHDMQAKVDAETTGRRKAEESAVSRLKKIQDLETALSHAKQNADDVEQRLLDSENREGQSAEQVGALATRISSLSTALASANAEVDKLRATNTKLEQQYRNEVAQGEKAVSRMHEELIRAATRITEAGKGYKRGSKVRLANWELESDDFEAGEDGAPLTPASMVRFAEYEDHEPDGGEDGRRNESEGDSEGGESGSESVPGSVEVSRGKFRRSHAMPLTPAPAPAMKMKVKGRRKYDSGVGMSPLTESDEGYGVDSGLGEGSSELGGEDAEMMGVV